jgi:hypothetical protein
MNDFFFNKVSFKYITFKVKIAQLLFQENIYALKKKELFLRKVSFHCCLHSDKKHEAFVLCFPTLFGIEPQGFD